MTDMQGRKNLFINCVKQYLLQNNITFNEYETNSGSHYFHLNLKNSHPCIRISDHYPNKISTYCTTLLYNKSKRAKAYSIKERINKTMNNIVFNANTYSIYKEFEKING